MKGAVLGLAFFQFRKELLARMQELAARTQSLEDQLPNGTREPGLQAALSVLLADLLADLRAMMAQLPQP